MSESSITEKTPSILEAINKQVAKNQAREINKGLTQLKRLSLPPPKETLETDKTGKFITVPINDTQSAVIDEAYDEAEKTCTKSELELDKAKKKKKWFKWR